MKENKKCYNFIPTKMVHEQVVPGYMVTGSGKGYRPDKGRTSYMLVQL